MLRLTCCLTLTLIAACNPGKNDTDDGPSSSSSSSSTSSASGSSGSTDATESTDAADATGGTDASDASTSPNSSDPMPSTSGTSGTTGPDADEFGFICVELVKAESEESDPFAGTTMIILTLEYESCLTDFYTVTHPEYFVEGEEGTAVFAEWVGRLCSEPVAPALVACEVAQFAFNIAKPPFQMTVEYKALDAAQIDGRTLLWGPAPLAELAGCEPTARLVNVAGYGGEQLWSAQSWDNPVGTVKSEASGCIQVAVAKMP